MRLRAAYGAAFMGCVLLWIAGCDRDPDRGEAGESCTRRDDCAPGLVCIGQVCAEPARDAGAAMPAGEGGACRARVDCQEGLACTNNVCVAASAGLPPGARYSGRGESCEAKNDCVPELACVMGTCREVGVRLGQTQKGCHRVECDGDAACCADFVPNANCDAYRMNCETDPIFCNTYRSLCECNKSCVDELCVAAAPGCSSGAECTSQQTPYCVEGRCRQCDRDSSCPGQGTQCVDGVCMAACSIDENCPPLHACEDSACVEVGCRSDRECAFVTGDALAACRDGECDVPCEADTDCVSETERFQICAEGRCVFVGCEEDYECRALLHLENLPGSVRAVCR
jgi:hypothetical protein